MLTRAWSRVTGQGQGKGWSSLARAWSRVTGPGLWLLSQYIGHVTGHTVASKHMLWTAF